ncbi:hypothetical protein GF337_02020 [candidate division KSB1 bacterium]|nr:hypothetical protein [candidate division KSB1 bacterium]
MWRITGRLLLTLLIGMSGCSKDEKEKEQLQSTAEKEVEYSLSGETESQLYEIEMNYDSLMYVFEERLKTLQENPDNIEARKQLVEAGYDQQHSRVLAFGEGVPPENAQTPSLALNYAEKAAKIEAYRWAYQIKKWHADPTNNDSSVTGAELPSAKMLSKLVMPDSTVKVLVELKLAEMP